MSQNIRLTNISDLSKNHERGTRLTVMTVKSNYDYIGACVVPIIRQGALKVSEQVANGWIVENLVEFVNEAYFCYASASNENEEWKKVYSNKAEGASRGYPKSMFFKWTEKSGEIRNFNAQEYVQRIFLSFEEDLTDTKVFPQTIEIDFPPEFLGQVKKIFRRLIRIYSIIFHNESLFVRNDDHVFEKSLKQLLFFVWYWKLIPFKNFRKYFPNHIKALENEFCEQLKQHGERNAKYGVPRRGMRLDSHLDVDFDITKSDLL